MKVLPVYLLFPTSFWGYNDAVKLLGKKAAMPPTGLATVAAMLPEKYFDVHRIIDLNVEPLTERDLKETDIVFTSSMIVQKESLEDVIDRAHFHGKKVVAGGPYPTSYGEEVPADYLVLGEAEITLEPFLKDILDGSARRIYEEKSFASSRPIPLSKGGKPLLVETPLPRWDLLNLNNYVTMAVQYSRGCPFDCDFCDITKLYGRETRTKTPEQMTGEFDALYDSGWRGSVFVVDDNFIGNKRNVRQLLPALKTWQQKKGYPYTLFTEASMDLAMPNHHDILEGMVNAGFDMVFVGIESIDPEVLKKMQKGQNLGNPYEKIKTLQEAGLEVTGGFIVGSDKEKPTVFENLFKFIQESGVKVPMPGLLTALKGTDLYNRLEQEGRLLGESSGNNTHHLSFNFKTELDEEFLINGYVDILKKLFNSGNYYDRCRVLNSRRGKHNILSRMNRDGLAAFGRILHHNLFVNPDAQFFRYLGETAFTHPKQLPEAVADAIKLHHFKKMTEGTTSIKAFRDRTRELYDGFCSKTREIQGNAQESIRRLAYLQQDILNCARKEYQRVKNDFWKDARIALDNLENRIRSYLPASKLQQTN